MWASSFILRLVFFFLPIEIPPEKEKPLLQSLAGAAFCCISPLHNEPQPDYPALRSLTPHSSDAPSPHTLTLPGGKKNHQCYWRKVLAVHAREKRKREKGLTASAASKTSPLPSYNKQERQNQNTAPTSPSIHPAQAARVPATTHKQLHCKTSWAHTPRWPEQQKSPAQEAWM